jgi:hypothetical protein
MRSFRPTPASTVNIDVGASSASVKLTDDQNGPTSVRVMNNGTATAWVDFGSSTVAAALTTSIPVPAGGVEVLTAQSTGGPVYVAAIAAGSTGKIYFTLGQGI